MGMVPPAVHGLAPQSTESSSLARLEFVADLPLPPRGPPPNLAFEPTECSPRGYDGGLELLQVGRPASCTSGVACWITVGSPPSTATVTTAVTCPVSSGLWVSSLPASWSKWSASESTADVRVLRELQGVSGHLQGRAGSW